MAINTHVIERPDIAESFSVNDDGELILKYKTYTPKTNTHGFVNFENDVLFSKKLFEFEEKFLHW